jgi:hypothetical protein
VGSVPWQVPGGVWAGEKRAAQVEGELGPAVGGFYLDCGQCLTVQDVQSPVNGGVVGFAVG